MLEGGYGLSRIEILNWGNFHGYQKFSLHEASESGPLFSPPSASAILGVNGSGKSTLIDALMIALLPFEGSLKLGVTNDVESGSGGGRTIRDYVLGKHSSSTGIAMEPEAIYGRKDGCSFILLTFAHNSHPDRKLTLGRTWWYQNYKVSDTQLAFLSYRELGLQALCPDGKTPVTAKAFRQHLRTTLPHVQPFETVQAYFSALSQALGGISRDDLKILNRAFFVKSISNIDQFIRENMLIEQDNPNLDRLMENVRSGQEIAFSIENCEAKLSMIGRILRELNRLREFSEKGTEIERRLRLLSLHREWLELRDLLRQQDQLASEILAIETRLPIVRQDSESATESLRSAQARLRSSDVETVLAGIESELRVFKEKISWTQKTIEKWRARAQALLIKLPSGNTAWLRFLEGLEKKIEANRQEITALGLAIEGLREKKFAGEAVSRELREELEHISKSGTLIPRDLHAIRQEAVKALKIPTNHLLFVGELIQVKREFKHCRRAVESVLVPIARNLLCHPDTLSDFTRWLDQEGLRADVTAKRIDLIELEPEDRDNTYDEEHGTDSILSMIELRQAADHPFYIYLKRWLHSTFNYRLVDLKRFKTEEGKLVTSEGLVKKDRRTMRKLKRDFAFSLGWDNADTVERLTIDLHRLNTEHLQIRNSIEAKLKNRFSAEEGERLYLEIKEGYQNVSSLDVDSARVLDLEAKKQNLLAENPDYEILRREVLDLETRAQGLMKGLLSLESEHTTKGELSHKVKGLLPLREENLKGSKLFHDLKSQLGGESALETALLDTEKELARRAVSRLQAEGELKEEAQKMEAAKGRAISLAAVNLGNYRHTFNDPNLPYDMGVDFQVDHFIGEWNGAEERLKGTELPKAQEKWKKFFDQVLLDSVKDTINEIKSRVHEAGETIRSINDVLQLTNFEDLATEKRYLRIDAQASIDERIRKFRKSMGDVERTLSPSMRAQVESQSQLIMSALLPFVDDFQKDPAYRTYVTDVRNHFQFSVHSLRREIAGSDVIVEVFSGARKDAKSSAQTTQLAYALLASCLAYRFKFHDPVAGADTPRLIILDEFGGKFDNEKPREILKLLDQMGFQSVLVSPMSKMDLLADGISHLVLVHKVSAERSKVQSYRLSSKEDYERLLATAAQSAAGPSLVT